MRESRRVDEPVMRWKRPNESVEFIVELENVGIVRWLDELLEVVLKERERGVTISFELQFARRSTKAKMKRTVIFPMILERECRRTP